MRTILITALLCTASLLLPGAHAQPSDTDTKPLTLLRAEAEKGDAQAQDDLGIRYWAGQGVALDYGEAVKWWREAAEQNHAAAQYNLGICYCLGQGVATNYEEAEKWLRKAAEQNHAQAQFNLGACYHGGNEIGRAHV